MWWPTRKGSRAIAKLVFVWTFLGAFYLIRHWYSWKQFHGNKRFQPIHKVHLQPSEKDKIEFLGNVEIHVDELVYVNQHQFIKGENIEISIDVAL